MGTSEIVILALVATVAAVVVLLAIRGKAAGLEGQLAARAIEAERLEALRAQAEAKLNQQAETTGHAQAKAQAALAQVEGLLAERDAARASLAEASAKIASLDLQLAAATTKAVHAEESKVAALTAKDAAAADRERALKEGHETGIAALREAHAKAERAMSEGHARDIESKARLIEELTGYIAKCDETLKQAFGDASAKALSEAMKGFDERAQARFRDEQERAGERSELEKREIARLLEPMHKELAELEDLNKKLDESRVKAEGALDEKLQRIQQTSESLANALRKPGVRGTWGEGQLKTILDSAGMTEGVHYRLQDHTEAEGDALRTDVIIMLPKGREVVIDSKAPLTHYEAAMNAATEEERVRCGEAHARSVRGHFRTLRSKEYWRRYPGSPDCVILFIPYEGAYQLACEHDKTLLTDCHAQKVILSNPMTLMGLVHMAAYALQEDRMKGDIEKVRAAATTLCERLGKVYGYLASHRRHLGAAVDSYNEVVGSIERRLVPSTRTMEALGIADARLTNVPTVMQANIRILPVAETEEESETLFALPEPEISSQALN